MFPPFRSPLYVSARNDKSPSWSRAVENKIQEVKEVQLKVTEKRLVNTKHYHSMSHLKKSTASDKNHCLMGSQCPIMSLYYDFPFLNSFLVEKI